jgi:hypothetical protein
LTAFWYRNRTTPQILGSGGRTLQAKWLTRNEDGSMPWSFIIFWNLWIERNGRIFNNAYETVMQVVARIKDDIEQRRRTFR